MDTTASIARFNYQSVFCEIDHYHYMDGWWLNGYHPKNDGWNDGIIVFWYIYIHILCMDIIQKMMDGWWLNGFKWLFKLTPTLLVPDLLVLFVAPERRGQNAHVTCDRSLENATFRNLSAFHQIVRIWQLCVERFTHALDGRLPPCFLHSLLHRYIGNGHYALLCYQCVFTHTHAIPRPWCQGDLLPIRQALWPRLRWRCTTTTRPRPTTATVESRQGLLEMGRCWTWSREVLQNTHY